MTEVKITLADFRNSRSLVCRNAKPLFFQRFGLDWRRFVREGMTAEELRGPGQHLDLIDRLEASALDRIAGTTENG